MAVYTTTTNVNALLPDQYGPLVIQPAMDASIFAQVATIAITSSTEYRIPIVAADPTAAWVAEGAEITPSDPTLQELVVAPPKVAGLTIISRELADDSSPAAAQVVGDGLARDIARRIDQAAFAGLAAPAPAGLSTLSGVQTYVNAGAFGNLDFAAEAISKAETVGATITAFVAGPATALALAKVKQSTGSNQPVLGMDATSATSRQILGVPLFVSQYVAANTLWAIDSSRVWLVVREDATVEVDRSVFFTSDRVAVKAVMRAGFGFVHPQSVVKVTIA
ncbi:MAG: phage major capsid protein [Propionibacteriales bacterium]|nr:phage major capsid protein [Propionibacteriales bacterium]